MAKFVSVELDSHVDLINGDGTGIVGTPLSERITDPDPMVGRIDVSSTEVIFNVPVYEAAFKLAGYEFSYDGSGGLLGFSGHVTQEILEYRGATEYILSEIDVPILEYFMQSTWASILSGNDQIYASDRDDQVEAGSGNDLVEAGRGFDTVYSGLGNDYIQGGYNGDQIYGEEGNDDLRGGNGLDLIVGGVGNDTIRGAKGTDTLTGGEGSDVFIFHTELDGVINIDTITDFVSGTDHIELSAAVFGSAGAVGSQVGLSQYIIYNAATGLLSYDADGSGSGVALAFAVLGATTHPLSVATDMWVVA